MGLVLSSGEGGPVAEMHVLVPSAPITLDPTGTALAPGQTFFSTRRLTPIVVCLGPTQLGLVLSSTFVLLRNANSMSNLLEYPVWLVTGLLISLSLLPGWTRPISWILAPTWGIRGLRQAAVGGDPVFPVVMCVALGLIYLVIGHFTLGYFEVRARKSATLALR